jgi:hypothetical protein
MLLEIGVSRDEFAVAGIHTTGSCFKSMEEDVIAETPLFSGHFAG